MGVGVGGGGEGSIENWWNFPSLIIIRKQVPIEDTSISCFHSVESLL